MDKLLNSKYVLFAAAAALFLGCTIGSFSLISSMVLLPCFLLAALLAFTNRHKKSVLSLSLLLLILLIGIFQYSTAADSESGLQKLLYKTVELEAVAAEEPIPTEYGYKLLLKNVYYTDQGKMYSCKEKVQLYVSKEDQLRFGDRVRLKAELDLAARARNFGDFDFLSYYKSKGIYVKAYAVHITKLGDNQGGFFSSFLYACNQKVKATIYAALPQEEAALLYGILTGSKTDLDEETKQVFSQTGLAHILSVSGLHIGFLVAMIGFLLRPIKMSSQLQGMIVFAVVLFYIVLIGAPIPAVRALLMLAVLLWGNATGKRYDLIASASFAALLLLLYNPLVIHDPGFIISFACIYAIGFFHMPVNKVLYFLPSFVRGSLSLSISVWIGITPILIHYFNYVSVVSVVLNVLAVPLAFLITLGGFAAVLVGLLLPAAAVFVFAASYYLIRLLYLLSERALLIPMAGFHVPNLGLHLYFIYYAAALMLLEEFWQYKSLTFKRNYRLALGLGVGAAMLISVIPYGNLQLYFVDVGQGDCSVIKTPNNKVIVVDGGGNESWRDSSFDIGEKLTVPALRHLGIWQIDTVIVSHIHEDHIGGILPIVEAFPVKQVLLPASERYGEGEFASESLERLIGLCNTKKIPLRYLQSNSSLEVSSHIKLKILAPEQPYLEGTPSDVNNNSLVFKLMYKEFDALFTGDIQQEAEEKLAEEDISCDVLKVAHHGSPYSSITTFLEAADPEVSIISVGKNNYGHPAKEALDRLVSVKSRVLRTDEKGAILISTNGRSLKIKTVRR